MNKRATRQEFKNQAINITQWCKKHGVSYSILSQLLNRPDSKMLFTGKQMEVVKVLKSENLYVPSKDEKFLVENPEEIIV